MDNKIFIGDFETSTGNDGIVSKPNITNVYLYGLRNLDHSISLCGVNLYQFFQDVKRNKIKRIFFHNLTWDCTFILHHLLENDYIYERDNTSDPLSVNGFTMLMDERKKIYEFRIRISHLHVVKLSDTALLLPMSVDKMGEILEFPKGEIDYTKYKHFNDISEVPEILLEYLWRDIDIVIKFYSKFKSTIGKHKMTIGSSAQADFIEFYGKADYIRDFGGKTYSYKSKKTEVKNVLTEEEWEKYFRGFRGGQTSYLPHYLNTTIESDIESADANSMYPSMMAMNTMPFGAPLKEPPMFSSYKTYYTIFIYDFKLKDKNLIPIIPDENSKDKFGGKYLSEGGQLYFGIWKEELEIWEQFYHINYKIIDTDYFLAKDVFSGWVNKWKDVKESSHDEIERMLGKLFLNVMFGKNAQRHIRGNSVLVLDPLKKLSGTRYGKNDEWVLTKETTKNELRSYVPIASYITALSRVTLNKAILANYGRVLYCDTDSIYVLGKIVGIEIDKEKFGAWKPEIKATKFKYIKAKSYIALQTHAWDKHNNKWVEKKGYKRALSGISVENHDKINFDNFYRGYVLEKGKKQKSNVKGGLILREVDYTM